MYFLKSLVSKNIERWNYKMYVLFVDSCSENDFLRIFAFFSRKNVDNEDNLFQLSFIKLYASSRK